MKNNILIILIIIGVAVIAGGIFFFMGKSPKDNAQWKNQKMEQVDASSLAVGNWVSVSAEKVNGSYDASMIMVCASKDDCQTNRSNQEGKQNSSTSDQSNTTPSDSSTGRNTGTSRGNMANRTMLSGTITEANSSSMTLNLDTGETTTVTITSSTRIIKR